MSALTLSFFLFLSLSLTHISGFFQASENQFLSQYGQIIADSYSQPLPDTLIQSTCRQNIRLSSTVVTLPQGQTTATRAQQLCGIDVTCIVPMGGALIMDRSLVVGALLIQGQLVWTDGTQTTPSQWLCAGYVVADGGDLAIQVANRDKQAIVYIKNNGAIHAQLRTRSFGGYNGAKVKVQGSILQRTWSLLARPGAAGMNTITLMHDANGMGWQKGDRIVIAPTTTGSAGLAEAYSIAGIQGNTITLGSMKPTFRTTLGQSFGANQQFIDTAYVASMSAEVIHLTRNVLITGDDLENVPCDPQLQQNALPMGCVCTGFRTTCTVGLHSIGMGVGTVLQMQYTRVEKCGQRGILGKYCIHLHQIQSCPDCLIKGNAVEFGMQRGITIHGTHLATLEQNVINDVRGSNIYIEDGNEMNNNILYNVMICPWSLKDALKQGCTIPGTDNDQADTELNQSGIWALSFTNDIVGNRAANSFNGMLYQAQGFEHGRQFTENKACPDNQQIGRLEGNTFHGHGRFGTYVLVSIYPKKVARSVDTNGMLPAPGDFSSCGAATEDGVDRGLMSAFYRNLDYDNVFVGQYSMGDIQYREHMSIKNLNLLYWKESKNPADGCASLVMNSYYANGNMGLPGGHGSLLLENIVFAGTITLESNHHCQEGWTGVLCMPSYIFVKPIAPVNSVQIKFQWGKNNGAMYSLSPDDEKNIAGNLFPSGFVSLAHPYWTYLMALDDYKTCTSSAPYGSGYSDGLLCRRPLRRLELYTPNQRSSQNPPNLRLELWQYGRMISFVIIPYFQIWDGNLGKNGYSATIIPGLTHQYRLMRQDMGPIPTDWVIEFSDPIFGNRWYRDEIYLNVKGRSCPSVTNSQHDRRYTWYDSDNHEFRAGRGACTNSPPMPAISCRNTAPPPLGLACPEKCPSGCNNGHCDCGKGVCQCDAGFSGPNCANDICSSANCYPNLGRCTSRYLGSSMPANEAQCVCRENIYGARCDIDPCQGVTCGGHGVCRAANAHTVTCTCDNGWGGAQCSTPCANAIGGVIQIQTNAIDIMTSVGASSVESCRQSCASTSWCQSSHFYNGNACALFPNLRLPLNVGVPGILISKCDSNDSSPTANTIPLAAPRANAPIQHADDNTPEVIHILAIAPVTETCQQGCQYQNDTIFNGADLYHIDVGSPQDCCTACRNTGACVAWTYTSYGKCTLKSGEIVAYEQAGTISGTICATLDSVVAAPQHVPTTVQQEEVETSCADCDMSKNEIDIDYMGLDRGHVVSKDVASCCQACRESSACHAYTFHEGICYFKSTSAGRVRRMRATSGVLCDAKIQLGYQTPDIVFDAQVTACTDDKTCTSTYYGKLSTCVRIAPTDKTGYCHCTPEAYIAGSQACLRATLCPKCPPLPKCSSEDNLVMLTAAAPDQGRCCANYRCATITGQPTAFLGEAKKSTISTGPIIGMAAGGTLLILLIGALMIWRQRRARGGSGAIGGRAPKLTKLKISRSDVLETYAQTRDVGKPSSGYTQAAMLSPSQTPSPVTPSTPAGGSSTPAGSRAFLMPLSPHYEEGATSPMMGASSPQGSASPSNTFQLRKDHSHTHVSSHNLSMHIRQQLQQEDQQQQQQQ